MESEDKPIEFEYKRLWQFFEFHANQRLTVFRFFIVLAGVIVSGIFTIFVNFSKTKPRYAAAFDIEPIDISTNEILLILFVLSFLLLIITIVFWILDNRNAKLIDLSKKEIINLENTHDLKYKLFNIIEGDTVNEKRIRFKHCFYVMYLLFILTSLFGIIWTIIKLCG